MAKPDFDIEEEYITEEEPAPEPEVEMEVGEITGLPPDPEFPNEPPLVPIVPDDQIEEALNLPLIPLVEQAGPTVITEPTPWEDLSTSAIAANFFGGLRGLTAYASDIALGRTGEAAAMMLPKEEMANVQGKELMLGARRAFMSDEEFEEMKSKSILKADYLRKLQEEHPVASTWGEIQGLATGIALPQLAGAAGVGPASALSQMSEVGEIAAQAAGKGVMEGLGWGLGAQAAGAAAKAGIRGATWGAEGALYGLATGMGEAALSPEEHALVDEVALPYMMNHVKGGGILGAGMGGLGSLGWSAVKGAGRVGKRLIMGDIRKPLIEDITREAVELYEGNIFNPEEFMHRFDRHLPNSAGIADDEVRSFWKKVTKVDAEIRTKFSPKDLPEPDYPTNFFGKRRTSNRDRDLPSQGKLPSPEGYTGTFHPEGIPEPPIRSFWGQTPDNVVTPSEFMSGKKPINISNTLSGTSIRWEILGGEMKIRLNVPSDESLKRTIGFYLGRKVSNTDLRHLKPMFIAHENKEAKITKQIFDTLIEDMPEATDREIYSRFLMVSDYIVFGTHRSPSVITAELEVAAELGPKAYKLAAEFRRAELNRMQMKSDHMLNLLQLLRRPDEKQILKYLNKNEKSD